MMGLKQYVVYVTPIDTVLVDWNETLWKYGYPLFEKCDCREVERGYSFGGKALGELSARMSKKYGVLQSPEELERRFEEWKWQRARAYAK